MCRIEDMLNGKRAPSADNATNNGATVPLLVTSKRVTTTSGAVPYTRSEGRVNITPMDRSTLEWDMGPFFTTQLSGPCTLVVESITQRSMETTYWAQANIPTMSPTSAITLTVELNGRQIETEDSLPLSHGDVVVFTIDNAEKGEQEILSMHFVDLNTFGGRGVPQQNAPPTTIVVNEHDKDHRIAQLEKEVMKLLDVVTQQSRTIEYQCQRQNATTMRSGTNTAVPSRATSTANPPSERSVATIASPDISHQMQHQLRPYDEDIPSLDATALLASFNAAARPSASSSQSRSELNSLSPPTAANSRPMTILNASRGASAVRADEGSRYEAALEENRRLQHQLAECQDAMLTLEMDNGALLYRIERLEDTGAQVGDAGQTTPRPGRTPRCPLPTDSPMRPSHLRRGRPDSDLSATELRERLLSSRRERALKEEISKLEGTIEDLHQQMRSIERMMDDASSEHSIELHEAQSEAAELSRALLATSAEYDNVCAQLESLQKLARRAEDAVTEVAVGAEVELERRLSLMTSERRALMTMCKLWKYRAVDAEVKISVLTREDRQSIAAQSKAHMEETVRRLTRSGSAMLDAEEAAVSALLESVDKECDAELVDILKTNVRDLEREKLELKDIVHSLASSLESHRLHMSQLEEEKSRLEREKYAGDDSARTRSQTALKKKCEELAAADFCALLDRLFDVRREWLFLA
ncbi:kinesin, putative [Bodo saltans]|uniref:Kinesin, putative n=1 Tax=Bodo saltans TaxID=75058 RepID=A0A0S4KKF1_BODSA|nr:kinesin, putative [Bodo saltans]|eukprot:CUI14876.1 kinesin, putative [Bodo saltans]